MAIEPADADDRRAIVPVICYPNDNLPLPDLDLYRNMRQESRKILEVLVPPRQAACFSVSAGQFFRVTAIEGPQVGDLNLWNSENFDEKFYSGKTRALHGTHLTTGCRMWSSFPYLRPMTTILEDTLDWYGVDKFGGSVHDVIGTRCDPYTQRLLHEQTYHHCCHSNLARAVSDYLDKPVEDIEDLVHDVLNIFMCTGFTRDKGQYFMKASPARAGDYLEFFAEINLVGALSACPGGSCSDEHSSNEAVCYPLQVEVFASKRWFPLGENAKIWKSPSVNTYNRSHGR